MTDSQSGTHRAAPMKASPAFRIEPVPYTNYPGRYYQNIYRVACTDCDWRGPSRNYNYTPDRLLIQYDQNGHELCRAAEAQPAATETGSQAEAGL
jgi:hypothetical protein